MSKRPPTEPLAPEEHAVKRITRHLGRHPDGVSSSQLHAWIESVRKGGEIGLKDFERGLQLIRDRGIAGFANGVWYLRSPFRDPGPPKPSPESDNGPLFSTKPRT